MSEATTEQAFEAWARAVEAESGRPNWKEVNEFAAFEAGVAEGIRQAREAAMGAMANPAVSSSGAASGVVEAVAAIDNL